MEDASIPPWSDLPPKLVGSIVTRLPTAADCARLRAVCRSWRSAMRHHGTPARHSLPWVVLSDGRFLASFDGRSARSCRLASFPDKATCFGSTGSWVALNRMDAGNKRRCFLHEPFTSTTIPHPELDTVIDDVLQSCFVRKVLMRSGPDDLVALMTTHHQKYPLVLSWSDHSGNGVSVPKEEVTDLRIIDIAFLGDELYCINKWEELYYLAIAFDDDGVPIVTSTQLVIEYFYEESDEGDEEDEEDNDANFNYLEDLEDNRESDESNEAKIRILIVRRLVASRGKLFMVKQQMTSPKGVADFTTQKVEVFEADIKAGAWKPLVGGLGGGQVLFIGRSIIKFVPACGEIEEDTVYFMDTGKIFSYRSQTYRAVHSQPNHDYEKLMGRQGYHGRPMWIFPPDLVV